MDKEEWLLMEYRNEPQASEEVLQFIADFLFHKNSNGKSHLIILRMDNCCIWFFFCSHIFIPFFFFKLNMTNTGNKKNCQLSSEKMISLSLRIPNFSLAISAIYSSDL